MTASTTGFRPEIQGLRALAILGVVGFHAMPGIFPGGFVGVDIFFVISGYLITRTLLRDVEARRYSIPMFYARRIARLFPALFLMFAVVTVAALAILPPAYLREFFATLSASSAFVANLHFGQHVDYFAEAADLQPLLHTWSLSIEEQFYIVYPIILVALIRLPPWARVGVMVVALWGSLAWATIPVPSADFLRFYSPFTRAYELLIGCVLAIRFDAPSRSTVVSAGEVIFGGSLIATSLLLFAPGQDMPSWRALVPCLGCALVIHGARGAPARISRH